MLNSAYSGAQGSCVLDSFQEFFCPQNSVMPSRPTHPSTFN